MYNHEPTLIIDLGGGTVDITAHSVSYGKMKMYQLPHGRLCGGVYVNENFKKLLEALVRDKNLVRYVGDMRTRPDDDTLKNRADLVELLYVEFEFQKVNFTSDAIEKGYDISITIPGSFLDTYGTNFTSIPGVRLLKRGIRLMLTSARVV